VILIAPLGSYFRFFSICATISYMIILYAIFFTDGKTVSVNRL
jgi:hypothetical protein